MTVLDSKYQVSIIIPVYAVSAYIERCIKSVMRQSYDNIECIIVDDVTPDDSIVKCETMIDHYQGPISFTILHHDRNRGLSASRNTGTNAAKGEYIFYLDGDDELTPDCIEILIKPVQNDATIEMVMGNREAYSECESKIPTMRSRTSLKEIELDSNADVRNHYFSTTGTFYNTAWNKLIKKSFLINHQLFFKEGILWEDVLWFFYVQKYLSHLYIIPDVTLLYYSRPQSIITGTKIETQFAHWAIVYEEIANHFSVEDKGREAKHYLKGFCGTLIYNYKNQNSYQVADLFKSALSEGSYMYERLYLSFSVFLSKSELGRRFFALVRDSRKVIRTVLTKRCKNA